MKMDQSVDNIIHVKQETQSNYDTTPEQQAQSKEATLNVRLVDQFCRLCLRRRPDLVPLLSRIQHMSVPDVFRAITGLEIILEDTYPLRMCRTCMALLDYAFDISQNFIESYRILKTFVLSKAQPLINNLSNYQAGVRASSETLAERMLREYRDLTNQEEIVDRQEAASKQNPSVSIPQPQVEPIELPVQIKQEPELILEPEVLPNSPITDAEAITNNENELAEAFNKMFYVISRHKLDPKKCYICYKVFETRQHIKVHLSDHVNMMPYQCSACTMETGQELKITSLSLLYSHFWMHAIEIKCHECPHRARSRRAMQIHIRESHEHSDKVEYTCEQCGKKFLKERTLYRHVLGHKALDAGRFPCSYCDKKLPSRSALNKHERKHVGEKSYQCYASAKSLCSNSNLKEDISEIHPESEQANNDPIRTCKFEGCDFSTTKRGMYYRHKAKHELKFQCSACSMRFPTKAELRQHQYVHKQSGQVSAIRTCKFEGCDFSTTNQDKYHRHKANHELNFQCSQCPQRFPTGRHLQKHQYVHTGVKRFQCDQCDQSFHVKSSLAEHIAVHNNDRRYACKICEFSFVRKRELKNHLLKHSTTFSFECRHCAMKFRYRSDRANHEKKHTKTDIKLNEPSTDVAEGTMKTEAIDGEGILRDCRDSQSETSYESAPKFIPCDSIHQTHKKQIELPISIKHEPELFLEPEERPTAADETIY